MDTKEDLILALEHAPAEAKCNPDIHGWRTPAGLYLHAKCGARIMARGCRLPAGTLAVWMDQPEAQGSCVCGAP